MHGLVTDSSSAKKAFRVISTRIFCDISMTPAFPVNNDCHDRVGVGGICTGTSTRVFTSVVLSDKSLTSSVSICHTYIQHSVLAC